ncbi:MAG: DUF433 domain-containing protein [Nodosilinea sp.]
MPLTTTDYKHIVLNDRQVPIIEGSTMKVIEIAMAQRAHGWTPEEIQINHRHLTMGQIYGALSYYWDHKAELEAAMDTELQEIEILRQAAGESPFVARLKAQNLHP